MAGRTAKSETRILLSVRGHERAAHVAPHWALLPFVAGVVIGLVLSTAILVRPYTESITNVYIGLSEEDEQQRVLQTYKEDFRKLLRELEPQRWLRDEMAAVEKLSDEVKMKDPVYYAIIMTDRHSSDQVDVLRETWARDVPDKDIGFFLPPEEGVEREIDEEDVHYGEIGAESGPLVELPSSHLTEFHTLRYICKHKLNETKWFFVANEDVYIKTRSLERYLQPYEGMAGMGYLGKPVRRDPIGRLCMPGPGTVLSYSLLAALCPKIDKCFSMEGSFESECAIGECVNKNLGLQCNREGDPPPQELFLKFDGSKQGMITEPGNHRALETALTVYPVSDPKLMYLIHQFVVSRILNETQHELNQLKAAVDLMTEILPQSEFQSHKNFELEEEVNSKDEVPFWKLINHDLLMSDEENSPVMEVSTPWKDEINLLVRKAVDYLNNLEGEEPYTFRKVVNAYWKVNPSVGIDYIIDFEATRPSDNPLLPSKRFRMDVRRDLNPPDVSPVQPYPSDKYVNIAVFLTSEQTSQFHAFMKMLDGVLHHDQRINLLVVMMKTASERQKPRKTSNTLDPKSVLSLYETKYPKAEFKVIDTSNLLSRAHGVSLVLRECRPSEIVFIADLDLEIDNSFVQRCRNFPIQGQQVYFPIMFAKANPTLLSDMGHTMLEGTISPHSGYWLVHSYSTACIHAADILAAISHSGFKGIPTEVGMMTVFDGLVAKKYEIIRATDKGLKRAYSAKRTCDLDLHGEIHDPCTEEADSYTSLYMRTQLSELLFDHEGEYSDVKF